MKKIREVKPPRGLAKLLFKLPNLIYNAGLGSMMGGRFLQLEHTGRKSGKQYKTVIEVVKFDPVGKRIYVISGFKQKSDWLKNIKSNPHVSINFKGKRIRAVCQILDKKQAQEVLLDYAHQHPLAMRELAKFMGYQVDGSDEDIRKLAGDLPMVEIQIIPKEK